LAQLAVEMKEERKKEHEMIFKNYSSVTIGGYWMCLGT
jgi:hypothetical protein